MKKLLLMTLFAKLLTVFLCSGMLLANDLDAQRMKDVKISLTLNKASLTEAFVAIERKTDFRFMYSPDLKSEPYRVSLTARNETVEKILLNISRQTRLSFRQVNNTIAVSKTSSATHLHGEASVQVERLPLIQVTGKVTDEEGESLPGVTILIKNTNKGTTTNIDGDYALTVSNPEDVLIFTSLGFEDLEIIVGSQTIINVTLKDDISELDEIVIIGYGTVKNRDLTGSVSSIDSKEIAQTKENTIDAVLAGRMAGVQVTKVSGQPGAGASIKIRGLTSINGSNEPLYVIDGIPITVNYVNPTIGDDGTNDSFNIGYKATPLLNQSNPLSSISPSDIESITVLKDASAAAIYGSRGANGVVIVTTKKGKLNQKPKITLDYATSIHQITNKVDLMNGEQWRELITRADAINGTTTQFFNANTDWQDEVLRDGKESNWNLGIRGGSPTTQYAASFSITDQEGIIRETDYTRYGGSLALSTKPSDDLTIGLSLNYSYSKQNAANGDEFSAALRTSPDNPVYNEDGTFFSYPNELGIQNPLQNLLLRTNYTARDRFLGSVFAEWTIIDGLKLRSAYHADVSNSSNLKLTPRSLKVGSHQPDGRRTDVKSDFMSTILENTLSYDRSFGNHHINAVAGLTYTLSDTKTSVLGTNGFVTDDLMALTSATNVDTKIETNSPSGLISMIGRVNYDYKNKYMATFTIARDGSTKFGPANQWAIFPSGALAWDLAQESAISKLKWFDQLKLRVSTGLTGSSNFADFQFLNTMVPSPGYNGVPGLAPPTRLANPGIKWEKTFQFDVGLDFSLFNKVVYGTVNYYQKNTSDLILAVAIPPESGAGTQFQNIGDISNKGVEIELGATMFRTTNFSWSLAANITFNKNKVEKLNGGSGEDNFNTQFTTLVEGKPFGLIKGYETDGIIQTQEAVDALNAGSPTGQYYLRPIQPGDYKFVDQNGDGRITFDDQIPVANPHPDYFGGFSSNFKYKNFDLSLLFQYSVGNEAKLSWGANSVYIGPKYNYRTVLENAWTSDNTDANIPGLGMLGGSTQNNFTSDATVSDASYLRLKNVSFSYTLRAEDHKLSFFDSIRFSLSATNLFTITNYIGADPEFSDARDSNAGLGQDLSSYPQNRYITLGVSTTF